MKHRVFRRAELHALLVLLQLAIHLKAAPVTFDYSAKKGLMRTPTVQRSYVGPNRTRARVLKMITTVTGTHLKEASVR
jgi:hypothetical protein